MEASEAKKTNEVKVGDRTVTIGRFSTFKAIHAGELLSAVLREVPDLSERISEFSHEFRDTNSVKISRAAAELRYPEQVQNISDAAWEQSGGYVELPASPGPLDMAAFVLPVAFDAARDRVLELVALVAIPNSDLQAADQEGNVAGRIDDEKKRLLHSDLGELIDLVVAAGDVLSEQFEGKMGKLRILAAKFGLEIAPSEEKAETTETTPSESNSKPSTPTDSARRTDGVPSKPSTERATTSAGSSSGR